MRVIGFIGLIGLSIVGIGCGGPGAGSAAGTDWITEPPPGGDGGTVDQPDINENDNVGTNGGTVDGGNDNTAVDGDAGGNDNAGTPFTVTSRSIEAGGVIGLMFARNVDCGGGNAWPQLSWSDPPAGTQSFLVMVLDEGAGDFLHWVVFDIAPTVLQISDSGPVPGGQTLNDYGQLGYGGPCPPSGEIHTYIFRVYALAIDEIGLTAGQYTSKMDIEDRMGTAILDQTEFTAILAGP